MSNNNSSKLTYSYTTTVDNSLWIWFVASRTVIVLLLMLADLAGNAAVLVVYRRDKKLAGAVYVKTLALVDVLSCALLLPQIPLLEMAAVDRQKSVGVWTVVTVQLIIQQLTYICVQVAMALDQFVAVFYPFKHGQLRKIINRIMLAKGFVLCALVLLGRHVLSHVVPSWRIIDEIVFVCHVTASLAILLVSYISVSIRLRQKSSTTIKPQATAPIATVAKTSQASTNQTARNRDSKQRAMHVQALKIYTAIFVLFVVTSLVLNFVIMNGAT